MKPYPTAGRRRPADDGAEMRFPGGKFVSERNDLMPNLSSIVVTFSTSACYSWHFAGTKQAFLGIASRKAALSFAAIQIQEAAITCFKSSAIRSSLDSRSSPNFARRIVLYPRHWEVISME